MQVANAQLNAGDSAGALATLAQVLPLVRGMEHSTKKVSLLHGIAYFAALAGDRAQGSQLAREMEKVALASNNPQALNNGLLLALGLWTSWDEFEEGLALIQRNPSSRRPDTHMSRSRSPKRE